MTDAKGRKLKVHKLCCLVENVTINGDFKIDYVEGTMPREDGDICIASYMNFLITNNGVIVPQYGDKNDELALDEIKSLNFERIILSPGWGNPDNSVVTMDVIDFYKDKCPILGVCLGMQCICKYFGAGIIKAPEPFHGKNSQIFFNDDFCLFKGLKQGFSAARYHSLMVSNTTDDIIITASTKDNIPMAVEIKGKKIYGVQFHPEAILTENGIEIFNNFISIP